MADPISFGASVLGLVGAAQKVGELLYAFGSSMVNAVDSVTKLNHEIESITAVFRVLGALVFQKEAQDIIRLPPSPVQPVIETLLTSVTGCVLIFSELEKLLDEVGDVNTSVWDKAKWATREGTAKELQAHLERHKATLNLALSALNIAQSEQRHVQIEQRHVQILREIRVLQAAIAGRDDHSVHLRSIIARQDTTGISIFETSTTAQSRGHSRAQSTVETASIRSARSTLSVSTVREPIRRAFESVLRSTRVYKGHVWGSALSLSSEVTGRTKWTYLTAISKISDLAVFELLLVSDIYNPEHYLSVQTETIAEESETQSIRTLKPNDIPTITFTPSALITTLDSDPQWLQLDCGFPVSSPDSNRFYRYTQTNDITHLSPASIPSDLNSTETEPTTSTLSLLSLLSNSVDAPPSLPEFYTHLGLHQFLPLLEFTIDADRYILNTTLLVHSENYFDYLARLDSSFDLLHKSYLTSSGSREIPLPPSIVQSILTPIGTIDPLPHPSQDNAVSLSPEAVTDRTSALQSAITISLSIIRDLVYTPFTTQSHPNIRPASRAKPISSSWEKIPLEIRRAFFVNHNTQETTWEDPRGGRNASSYPMRVAEGSKIPDVENKVPLPLGWEQMWYFYECFVDWENDTLIWNEMFEHTRRLWQQWEVEMLPGIVKKERVQDRDSGLGDSMAGSARNTLDGEAKPAEEDEGLDGVSANANGDRNGNVTPPMSPRQGAERPLPPPMSPESKSGSTTPRRESAGSTDEVHHGVRMRRSRLGELDIPPIDLVHGAEIQRPPTPPGEKEVETVETVATGVAMAIATKDDDRANGEIYSCASAIAGVSEDMEKEEDQGITQEQHVEGSKVVRDDIIPK